MNQKKKRLTCPGTDTPDVNTQGADSAPSLTKKELEELRYDTAVALLKAMSPGSVFQFALDKQLDLLSHYNDEELKNLAAQYKLYGPATKKQPKKKEKGGGGF